MSKISRKFSIILVLLLASIFLMRVFYQSSKEKPAASTTQSESIESKPLKPSPVPSPDVQFVGPRQNIPADAPHDYGFWSFAMPIPGILSRSGQPLISEFEWIRNKGWKSVIDLRADGEYGEVALDKNIPGFNVLGFHYLELQMKDGAPPTNEQAEQFLKFVTDKDNQPVHIHCRGGIGRTGVMVALYRYSAQGWPIEKAIEESRLFDGGVSSAQEKWLYTWAKDNPPGSYFTS